MAVTLIDPNRHLAVEVYRGHKWVHLIRFGNNPLHMERMLPSAVEREFKVREDIDVRDVALMFVASHFQTAPNARDALLGVIKQGQTKEQAMQKIDVKKATMPELVKFYNDNAPAGAKKVERFSDRAAAERRCAALMEPPREGAPEHKDAPPKKPKEKKPHKDKKTPKEKKPPKEKAASLSEATKNSWANKATAKARSTKHRVVADGTEYRSVFAAFEALKLPTSKVIKFRAELKAKGSATFDGHKFKLVANES